MLGRRQDAEDATQEVLIRVLKSLHTFSGDSKFSTWLYRIAANDVLNFKRQEWVASKSVCSSADAAWGSGVFPTSIRQTRARSPFLWSCCPPRSLRVPARQLQPGRRCNSCQCVRKTRAFIEGGFVDPQKLQFKAGATRTRTGHRRHVREIAETRTAECNLYRDHPFYEPAEQASMLRTALASVFLDATKYVRSGSRRTTGTQPRSTKYRRQDGA